MFKLSVVFINNRAKFGGGITSVYGNLSLLGSINFHNNSALLSGDRSGYGGGIFSSYGIRYFLGDTTLCGNTASEGGGVYGSKTITIDGRMNVLSNFALLSGGGFYLASGSECWVLENTSLLLAHNHAGQFGGAVYIQDEPFYLCIERIFDTGYQANCFFQPTRWPTTATIQILEDNHAEEAGSGLYVEKFWITVSLRFGAMKQIMITIIQKSLGGPSQI